MSRKNAEAKQRCELVTDPAKRTAADRLTASIKDAFPPGLSQPALRALASAGYSHLDQLATVDEDDLAALHGMGPKAIQIIRVALKRRGRNLRGPSPA
ncbi:MAG: helix-hairpin-helix domain-containing protein [Gemmatimonadaceae bacterium]